MNSTLFQLSHLGFQRDYGEKERERGGGGERERGEGLGVEGGVWRDRVAVSLQYFLHESALRSHVI